MLSAAIFFANKNYIAFLFSSFATHNSNFKFVKSKCEIYIEMSASRKCNSMLDDNPLYRLHHCYQIGTACKTATSISSAAMLAFSISHQAQQRIIQTSLAAEKTQATFFLISKPHSKIQLNVTELLQFYFSRGCSTIQLAKQRSC